jgi:hypothetical protein
MNFWRSKPGAESKPGGGHVGADPASAAAAKAHAWDGGAWAGAGRGWSAVRRGGPLRGGAGAAGAPRPGRARAHAEGVRSAAAWRGAPGATAPRSLDRRAGGIPQLPPYRPWFPVGRGLTRNASARALEGRAISATAGRGVCGCVGVPNWTPGTLRVGRAVGAEPFVWRRVTRVRGPSWPAAAWRPRRPYAGAAARPRSRVLALRRSRQPKGRPTHPEPACTTQWRIGCPSDSGSLFYQTAISTNQRKTKKVVKNPSHQHSPMAGPRPSATPPAHDEPVGAAATPPAHDEPVGAAYTAASARAARARCAGARRPIAAAIVDAGAGLSTATGAGSSMHNA